MDIIAALKEEESKLYRQLNAVQGAISALNGDANKASVTSRQKVNLNNTNGKRTMSAAVRARISRTAKARWAKIRAEKVAGKKTK
ncbi:MAG: hypothetical protein QOG55_1125 [Acidobacteriaceae bacterium]|jgi:hypothetical protein|nr:hypothetical protein [Acidobacteriaceae bacterium]